MDRTSVQDAEVAIIFLPYAMVVCSYEMGPWSTVCYVASSDPVTLSAEAKPSFMSLVNIVVSDRFVFTMSSRHS